VVQRVEEWKRGKGKYVPMELREKDIDYQRHRVKVFRDLLQRLLDTEGLKVAKGPPNITFHINYNYYNLLISYFIFVCLNCCGFINDLLLLLLF